MFADKILLMPGNTPPDVKSELEADEHNSDFGPAYSNDVSDKRG
jgi:hypothetical protein